MTYFDGEHLAHVAKQTFGREDVTKEELVYLITMMNPSSYLLKHHKVRNHPITFHVSGHDTTKAQAHRPWQVDR